MDKGGRGGASADVVNNYFFLNVIIKSVDMDKGERGGGKTHIHKMWITVIFFNPSLVTM